ncbi:MAG TPA: response regulator [Ohtaekwangia sp.]|uniref:response regulator n=1 Tax=Ohtaekwangia sp. TaxID=2066019 RepID=UPI002F93DFDB
MKFFRNLSIRNKLILLVVFPFSVVLFFLLKTITLRLEGERWNSQTCRNLDAVEHITALLHQLEGERTATVAYLATSLPEDKKEMYHQQEQTDQSLASLQEYYTGTTFGGTQLDSLIDAVRQRKRMAATPANLDLTTLGLLAEINKAWEDSPNAAINGQLDCLLFLLYAKEFLAQIRDDLLKASLRQGFQGMEYGNFAMVKGKHEINLYKFERYASPDLQLYFKSNYKNSKAVANTKAMLDSAFATGGIRALALPVDDWRAQVTSSINILQAMQLRMLSTIRHDITVDSEVIASALIRNSILAVLVVVVIVSVSLITIKEVVRSVNRMKDATVRIMNGDINFSLDASSKDEMGLLAHSFNEMITVFKSYVQLADAIGKGNYDREIVVRSDLDILGKALHNMKVNLEVLSREKETRAWLLAGHRELNNLLREEKGVRILAREIIGQTASYLKAQAGAIYLLENERLHLAGTYAVDPDSLTESFAIGESLVGQAAQTERYILFEDVPNDYYLPISSSLGHIVPTCALVYPFMHMGKVKGVLELGAAHTFSRLDLEYLQMVSNNIAIAFNSAQSRTRLESLLEETQHQAEELESQQEELRQFNDELLEKLESIAQSEAELKVQQEELQESNALLEEKANLLEHEKQQLEAAKTRVEEQAREFESVSKYKSDFLANMSHELRTPLNSILILTQLLMENKNGTLGEKELKYASVVYTSGNELLILINDILDLSKVEAGKMDLEINHFSFDEVTNDLNTMFLQLARNKSIEFVVNVNGNAHKTMESDKQRLVQILRNLLSNAFKFTPAGGNVTLTIKPCVDAQTLQSARLKDIPDIVCFEVKDTGIGIQKDKQEIIFEAFRQVDGTDKRKYGGTGLGLSICRELSGLLGGEIQLESEEGKGSTFTLYLPAVYTSDGDLQDIAPGSGNHNGNIAEHILRNARPVEPLPMTEDIVDDDRTAIEENSRKILILEDDREFADVLLSFVREREYKGIVSHQGIAGLQLAHQYRPDAILLDMKLPDIDGTEVIRQLKNDSDLRHIPVQIISGYSLKREAMKLGAFDFIRKPVKKEDLQSIFDKLEHFANRQYKRLLIVEDNEEENKAIQAMIGNGDVECIAAYSCDQAYEMLTQSEFDCMIVDLGIGDTACFSFLEKIRSSENLQTVPVIVYAAQELTADENKRLAKLANTVVLRTAYSHERLLDETTLFLHRIESRLPPEKQNIIRKLHRSDAVLKGKTVLIVDDDIRNIYSLTNVLEDEGLVCQTAENGREAIAVLNDNPAIDIILMDVMMPEMNGYEATQEIRKSEKFSKLPIIALTAKAMRGDREKCLASGMSDYVTKPVNTRQLLSLMRVWLYK